MAILGFIVYMIVTLKVTFLSLVVWSWPCTEKGEGIFLLVIAALFWYGAWYFNPFTIGMV